MFSFVILIIIIEKRIVVYKVIKEVIKLYTKKDINIVLST